MINYLFSWSHYLKLSTPEGEGYYKVLLNSWQSNFAVGG